MIQVLSERILKARKVYYDYGMEQVWEALSSLSFSDRMYIYKLNKKKGWKIQIGEKYYRQCNVFDGDFCTFRTNPKIWEIITKYKLFTDDF